MVVVRHCSRRLPGRLVDDCCAGKEAQLAQFSTLDAQRRVLLAVLGIDATMFVVELVAGDPGGVSGAHRGFGRRARRRVGSRKLRYLGIARNQLWFLLGAAGYNLIRIARLAPQNM